MGSPDEGVVERPELYLLAGEDGMKKMMNMEKLFDEVIISRLNGNHSYSYKQQKEEVTIVKESLRRELALSEPKLGLIREEVEGFEKRYEKSSDEDEFVDKFEGENVICSKNVEDSEVSKSENREKLRQNSIRMKDDRISLGKASERALNKIKGIVWN